MDKCQEPAWSLHEIGQQFEDILVNPSSGLFFERQPLDRSRPHTLIRGALFGTPVLEYHYDDTNETVTVLNIWENQTPEMRIASLKHTASVLEGIAETFKHCPMLQKSTEDNIRMAQDYRRRATLYRLMAQRLELLKEQGLVETFQELTALVEAA